MVHEKRLLLDRRVFDLNMHKLLPVLLLLLLVRGKMSFDGIFILLNNIM